MSNIERIQKMSRVFKYFFLALFGLLPLLALAFWLFYNALPGPLKGAGALEVADHLSFRLRALGFVATSLDMGIGMATLWTLMRLFALYEEGRIFTSSNVTLYRRLGWLLILGVGSNVLTIALYTLIVTTPDPQGLSAIEAAFGSIDVAALVIGLIVLLISAVMKVGAELQEDRDLTV